MKAPQYLQWSRHYFDGLRLSDEGRFEEARSELDEAVRIAKSLPFRDGHLACSLFAMGKTCQLLGLHSDAVDHYRHALAEERRALGEDHPYTRHIELALERECRRVHGACLDARPAADLGVDSASVTEAEAPAHAPRHLVAA